MKPTYLVALGVFLTSVLVASQTTAQKHAPPQPTEQQNLKDRVDALESQLKEAQAKADRVAIERIQKQHESDDKKVPSSQTTLDHTKTVVEISAYGAALVFFLYKVIAGYLTTQMGLTIACKRAHSTIAGNDHLAVVATLKKGKTGTLRLRCSSKIDPPDGHLAANRIDRSGASYIR